MSKPRILLVEDDVETSRMLDLYFSSRGYAVVPAYDGESALRVCREALPSLVLVDVGLPDIDGFEVYRRLRATARARYVPMIFLTEHSQRVDRIEGLGLGADDFIAKPFDLEELFLRVQNVLSRDAHDRVSDPRTSLPAGAIVEQELQKQAGRPDRRAIAFHLRHGEEFRDLYGAVAFADVLRSVALLLNNVLNEHGTPDDFVGQQNDEMYVVITGAHTADTIAAEAVRRFDADVHQHYSQAERENDQLQVRDAAGGLHSVSAMRLEATRIE